MNFEDKKVIIMGLGLHGGGVGAARFMAERGARVVVTDLKSKSELSSSMSKLEDYDLEFVLGAHREKDFKKADLVIKNPAVPWDSSYLKIAQDSGARIETAVSIFFKECPCECIGVTGTKGKSTTASLIFDILKKEKDRVFLAGNIGKQPLDLLSKLKEDSLVVLELSSWQLEGLGRENISPHVSVVTNVFSDHLNRYRSFAEYKEAKEIIISHQGKDDFAVLNYEDEITQKFTKRALAQVLFFGSDLSDKVAKPKRGAYFKGNNIFYRDKKILKMDEVPLRGKHNLYNIVAALSCVAIYDIGSESARRALLDFEPPEGRLEPLGSKRGLEVYNDTASTNPQATIEAIDTIRESDDDCLFLIAGGVDKALNYSKLAEAVEGKVGYLFLLSGDASEKLSSNLSSEYKEKQKEGGFKDFENLLERVLEIKKDLCPNNKVKLLLSPGAASFNLFKNEFDRGRKFVDAIEDL